MPPATRRPAFSLTELLIVLVMVTLLIGAAVGYVMRTRAAAARTNCQNNLKILALAVESYTDANNGRLPRQGDRYASGWTTGPAGSVHFYLEPYIETSSTYHSLGIAAAACESLSEVADIDRHPDARPIRPFLCPADRSTDDGIVRVGRGRYGVANYAVNLAVVGHANYGPAAKIATAYPDGQAMTILFAERLGQCGDVSPLWLNSDDGPPDPVFAAHDAAARPDVRPPQVASPSACDPRAPQALHGGVIQVAMADKSVRTISVTVSLATWRAAALPNDGATPGDDW